MITADKPEFAKFVTAMASHKRQTLSVMDHEIWWLSMQDWIIEEFKAAAIHLLQNCEWMPTTKHFADLRKAGRPTPAEAWDRAVKHCSSSGYRKGPLGDDLIDQCVRVLGGYQAIAMSDVTTLHFLERRFVEHYATIETAADTREAVPQIAQEPTPAKRLVGLKRLGVA